jgi:hypothetical protein
MPKGLMYHETQCRPNSGIIERRQNSACIQLGVSLLSANNAMVVASWFSQEGSHLERNARERVRETPMQFKALALAGVAAAMFAAPALAHHSFAMFDAEKTTTIAGTVKEFRGNAAPPQ